MSGERQRAEALEGSGPLQVERVDYEYIQKILQENDGSIAATARSPGLYRRKLQRKLARKPAAE